MASSRLIGSSICLIVWRGRRQISTIPTKRMVARGNDRSNCSICTYSRSNNGKGRRVLGGKNWHHSVFALGAAGILADQFFEIVAWVGAITALLLATQGMVNPEIKKVLAYSTGSQIGYMMMALGVAGLSEQYVDGYTAGFFHLISHAMFKASRVYGSRFVCYMLLVLDL